MENIKTSELIRSQLEDQIRLGELLPGDLIDEQALEKEFNVSKTPIREALLQLEAQNILVKKPRQGIFVAKLNLQQLLALWELLVEMEGFCAKLACQRMSDGERKKLADVHAQAKNIVDNNDIISWRPINQSFHEVLYEGSKNPYLKQELLRLRARTGGYIKLALIARDRLHSSFQEHGEILKAIQEKDAQLTYNMMIKHISLSQGSKGLIDFLMQLPPSLIDIN